VPTYISHTPLPCCTGSALWLDQQKQSCLILWRRIEEWAQAIAGWASTYGVSDAVMLVEELSSGDDVRGTGAWGAGPGLGMTQWAAGCALHASRLEDPCT
jgi:hypothetical protein